MKQNKKWFVFVGVLALIVGSTSFFTARSKQLDVKLNESNNKATIKDKTPQKDDNTNKTNDNKSENQENESKNETVNNVLDNKPNNNQNSNSVNNNLNTNKVPTNNVKPSENKPNNPTVVIPDQGGNNSENENKESQNPDISNKPSIPDVKDLKITKDDLNNNKLIIKDRQFSSLTIDENVPSDAQILLQNVSITNELNLNSNEKFQLDIDNSDVKKVSVNNPVMAKALKTLALRSNNDSKSPIINIEGTIPVENVLVNSNVKINGSSQINNLDITSGDNVALDIAINSLNMQTTDIGATLAINKPVNTIINNSSKAKLVINSTVDVLDNKASDIKIMINNENNVINNLKNEASNVTVLGTGKIDNLQTTENAHNMQVFSDVNNKDLHSDTIFAKSSLDIESFNFTSQGSFSFTLNDLADITLKDITIFKSDGEKIDTYFLNTLDNKTYNLLTSYFKEGSYSIYITLSDGSMISKDFMKTYKYPTAVKTSLERISNTTATLNLYGLYKNGYLYYYLEEIGSTDLSSYKTITDELIKNEGVKIEVNSDYNGIQIENLKEDQLYNLYYLLEDTNNVTSLINGPFSLSNTPVIEDDNIYIISDTTKEIAPGTFIINLNKAPLKKLSLDDISITCDSDSNFTLKDATFTSSADGLTYVINVKDNYSHKDNNYILTINVDDKIVSSSFRSHFAYPKISEENIIRTSENTVNLRFTSDERGTVYYGIYNREYDEALLKANTPLAKDILNNAEVLSKELLQGENTIEIDLRDFDINENTRIWTLYVDYDGNYRSGYVNSYGNIPPYLANEEEKQEEEDKDDFLTIEDIIVRGTYLKVYFNHPVEYAETKGLVIKTLAGESINKENYKVVVDKDNNVIYIGLNSFVLPLDDYNLEITVIDEKQREITLNKNFTIN